ncbi:Undecaprenyl-phosphate alpha-N-acetylglucosaminyl 1-phosphate transferase [hydrothermal vent metagenome]|uniref:Undecaprenyl-phosphate alpha-N-acetylglucosaminyl 1-phosphate transferase n=1 Tax=hydrothermal vent metagenome TaxID=652676 RepID=A0A3B1BWL6_9ZZZZ
MALLILSGLISFFLVYFLSRESSPLLILDKPNERSLHSKPTSRAGGVGILGGILFSIAVLIHMQAYPADLMSITFGVVLIAAVSLIDDNRGVSVRYRLLVHILAAVVLMSNDFCILNLKIPFFTIELYVWVAYLFTLLLILWSVNLFNFMDGMDGFAGGMAFIGFSTFAALGYFKGVNSFAALAAIIASANAAFLPFNFPPAKIFMGDSGSSVLGFLMAAMIIWADTKNIFPLWVGILVFSPFILDATVTLLKRVVRGEKIWEAHRSHFYQRLVLIGWGHRRTVIVEYIVMLICALFACSTVYFSHDDVELGVFIASILLYLLTYFYLLNYLRRQEIHAKFK